MSFFVLLMLPVLFSLGFWQLDRGEFKRSLEERYLTQLTLLPVAPDMEKMRSPFSRLRLEGVFQPEYFLIDNQVSAGKTGYWLIQVFRDERAGRLLVNRGFIPGERDRSNLPAVVTPPGRLSLVAVVWPDLGLIPSWEQTPWNPGWPKRVQRGDFKRMGVAAQAQPVELRLEPGQPGVANAAPFAERLSDDTHLGYAATWFGLALTLMVAFIFYGLRAARDN